MNPEVRLSWTVTLPLPPERAWAHVVAHAWRDGAGLPPTPRITDAGDAHGIGCTREIPVGPGNDLIERIEEGAWPAWFAYRVVNPSWRTFPVRHHRGEVRFTKVAPEGTRLDWAVTFVPLRGGRLPAWLLTRWVIGRYLRSLSATARDA